MKPDSNPTSMPCLDCGKENSASAKKCQHCGSEDLP